MDRRLRPHAKYVGLGGLGARLGLPAMKRHLLAILAKAAWGLAWGIGFAKNSSRMAAASCLGIQRSKPIGSRRRYAHSRRNRQCTTIFRLPAQLPRALRAPRRDDLGTHCALVRGCQRRCDVRHAGRACDHILGKPQAGLAVAVDESPTGRQAGPGRLPLPRSTTGK